MSELLAYALGLRRPEPAEHHAFAWTARPMHARVDLADKEAAQAALDRAALLPASKRDDPGDDHVAGLAVARESMQEHGGVLSCRHEGRGRTTS